MTNHLFIHQTAVLTSPAFDKAVVLHLEEAPDCDDGFEFYLLPMTLDVARELRNQLDVALAAAAKVVDTVNRQRLMAEVEAELDAQVGDYTHEGSPMTVQEAGDHVVIAKCDICGQARNSLECRRSHP